MAVGEEVIDLAEALAAGFAEPSPAAADQPPPEPLLSAHAQRKLKRRFQREMTQLTMKMMASERTFWPERTYRRGEDY